jgi:hypothetical protein
MQYFKGIANQIVNNMVYILRSKVKDLEGNELLVKNGTKAATQAKPGMTRY